MLEDVLSALVATGGLAGILLVTRDPEAQQIATRYGARVLVEAANRGHTAASSVGRTDARAGRHRRHAAAAGRHSPGDARGHRGAAAGPWAGAGGDARALA